MAETSNGAANGQAQQGQAQLSLQKIYVKDVSFEAPGAPQIFQSQATQPNVELNLSQRVTQLGEAAFEVVLSVTATCTQRPVASGCGVSTACSPCHDEAVVTMNRMPPRPGAGTSDM